MIDCSLFGRSGTWGAYSFWEPEATFLAGTDRFIDRFLSAAGGLESVQKRLTDEIDQDGTGFAHRYYELMDAVGWTAAGPPFPANQTELYGCWRSGNFPARAETST